MGTTNEEDGEIYTGKVYENDGYNSELDFNDDGKVDGEDAKIKEKVLRSKKKPSKEDE